jgi:hypothetical protein
MFKRPTVFLLGAGANVPYGFSTGRGLLEKARGIDPIVLMGNAGLQITPSESQEFRSAVSDNMLPSIDSMLEHRRDLWKVGKRVMATLLFKEEASAGPKIASDDWMALVFEKMAEDAPSVAKFAENPVRFITFNYDRYLEHRFIRALVARYRIGPAVAWLANSNMKFLHLHGSLGMLNDQVSGGMSAGGNPIPLGAPDTPTLYTLGLALPQVDASIRIVHDDGIPEVFAEAQVCLQSADQILFMGFGFGKTNVTRLRTDLIPSHRSVYCTVHGLTNSEINHYVRRSFPNHHNFTALLSSEDSFTSILKFLRNRVHKIE